MRRLLLALLVSTRTLPGFSDAFAGPGAAAPVTPVPADAGLAVAVTGGVTYKGAAAAQAAPVSPYMKLRVGDVVDVPAGARLEVLYFGTGVRELWEAESVLRVEAGKGAAVKGAAKTVVAGESVGKSLENLPIMLRQAQTYQAGQTLVRGGGSTEPVPLDEVELAQVAEARETYAQLRATAAAADVFPEMYLVSVLLPLGQDAEAKVALEKAVAACPVCEEPKTLLAWVNARTAPPAP